jgi:flagellar basal body-associated protein FliL
VIVDANNAGVAITVIVIIIIFVVINVVVVFVAVVMFITSTSVRTSKDSEDAPSCFQVKALSQMVYVS